MKFFLFRREAVTPFSTAKSNTGENLSVFGVPAENLSHMTAEEGKVNFTFKDAGVYEHSALTSREAIERTKVAVACEEGQEFEFMRNVMEFIGSDSKKNVMVFDTVSGFSTISQAKVSGKTEVNAVVPALPVVMSTQAISNDPASSDLTQTTTTTIADITFPAPSLMPIIDYNETGLAGLSLNDQVGAANTWANAGTGGTTFDITNDTGTPDVQRDNGIMGSNDLAVQFATSESLHLANTLEVEGAYTAYMVVGTTGPYSVFGGSVFAHSSLGTHIGFGATIASVDPGPDEFHVNHAIGSTYRRAFVNTNNTADGTSAYIFPDLLLDHPDVNTSLFEGQQTYVFVLRRDKENNLYVHNHLGDVVGFIPKQEEVGIGRTSGILSVDRIGGDAFRHNIPRVGIITEDIGTVFAAKLAKDLFEKYKFSV